MTEEVIKQQVIDNTLCIMGLLMLKDLLFMSRYDPELKVAISKRVDEVIANIQARQVYDGG